MYNNVPEYGKRLTMKPAGINLAMEVKNGYPSPAFVKSMQEIHQTTLETI